MENTFMYYENQTRPVKTLMESNILNPYTFIIN